MDRDRFLVRCAIDPDPAALRSELHGVRKQVDQDLAQLVRIGSREEVAGGRFTLVNQRLGASEGTDNPVKVCNQSADRNVDDIEFHLGCFEAREVQDVGDNAE